VYYQAIGLFDIPVIVGTTVLYAYLLAITVFLLDIIYAFIDPRVKVG
jgi:peptide/nickel transport system permease protein